MNRSALTVVAAFVVTLGAGHAAAAPIELATEKDAVAIAVEGVTAAGALTARGDRIEVPLSSGAAVASLDADDEHVGRVEVVGGDRPRLVVKLHHSRGTTARFAQGAELTRVGERLRLVLHTAGEIQHLVGPAPAQPAPELAAPATPATPPPAAPLPATLPAPPLSAALAAEPSTETAHASRALSLGFIGLLALGAVAYVARRRRAVQPAAGEGIRVLSSRTLGGRAQVVLLEAAGREVLVSVSEGGVQLLAGWPNVGHAAIEPAPSRAPALAAPPPVHEPLEHVVDEAPPTTEEAAGRDVRSSAVLGLLRLRDQVRAPLDPARLGPAVDEEAWLRELHNARAQLELAVSTSRRMPQ